MQSRPRPTPLDDELDDVSRMMVNRYDSDPVSTPQGVTVENARTSAVSGRVDTTLSSSGGARAADAGSTTTTTTLTPNETTAVAQGYSPQQASLVDSSLPEQLFSAVVPWAEPQQQHLQHEEKLEERSEQPSGSQEHQRQQQDDDDTGSGASSLTAHSSSYRLLVGLRIVAVASVVLLLGVSVSFGVCCRTRKCPRGNNGNSTVPVADRGSTPPSFAPTTVPTRKPFETTKELYNAVDDFLHWKYGDGDSSGVLETYGEAIGEWDVSALTDFSHMFDAELRNELAFHFDEDLSGWNTSLATNFSSSFRSAVYFTGRGLESWDTSRVTDFASTFAGCEMFDSDIGGWDMSSATTTEYMVSRQTRVTL
jgi:Mycoplasma protein of unknown function, DUF285